VNHWGSQCLSVITLCYGRRHAALVFMPAKLLIPDGIARQTACIVVERVRQLTCNEQPHVPYCWQWLSPVCTCVQTPVASFRLHVRLSLKLQPLRSVARRAEMNSNYVCTGLEKNHDIKNEMREIDILDLSQLFYLN